jgi:NTP pyrophosphatase (non-canonical NTP hydrolase)
MTYYLYHIPGKKIGVTRDLKERVENQQGYNEDEYVVLMETDDILQVSNAEILMQKAFGYKVDVVPYNKLKFNKMKINVTEQTTTFPMPLNKLKGRLMDNVGMTWETADGDVTLTSESIKWVIANAKTSMYNDQRCYVYNKAFARWFDNNSPYPRTGALAPTGIRSMDERKCKEYQSHDPEEHGMPECCNYDDYQCTTPKGSKHDCINSGGFNEFDLIRMWANQRGIYEHGDTKTQALKLMEEAGEICRAILKEDHDEVVDGIGDCVVVLTNLAELQGVSIEKCINVAYNTIAKRSGKMVNGTFKKD